MNATTTVELGTIDLYSLEGDLDAALKYFTEQVERYKAIKTTKISQLDDHSFSTKQVEVPLTKVYFDYDIYGDDYGKLRVMGERNLTHYELQTKLKLENEAKERRRQQYEALKKEFE